MPHEREDELTRLLGGECFLCAHQILDPGKALYFSRVTNFDMAPELPMHADCLNVRGPKAVAILYHQRIADLVSVPRVNRVQRYFQRLLGIHGAH